MASFRKILPLAFLLPVGLLLWWRGTGEERKSAAPVSRPAVPAEADGKPASVSVPGTAGSKAAEAWTRAAGKAFPVRDDSELDRILAENRGLSSALLRALSDAIRRRPSLADGLPSRLAAEQDEKAGFAIARVLQGCQTPARVGRTVAALRDAAPGSRAVGLHALLGRTEPEAVGFAVDAYLNDPDPRVQAKAAFVLQEVASSLPSQVFEKALERIRSEATPDVVKIDSLELLGMRKLSAGETQSMTAVFHATESPEVKNATLRALVTGGAERPVLRPLFQSAVDDESLPREMRDAAKVALDALPM